MEENKIIKVYKLLLEVQEKRLDNIMMASGYKNIYNNRISALHDDITLIKKEILDLQNKKIQRILRKDNL